jgi:hypothetical protein
VLDDPAIVVFNTVPVLVVADALAAFAPSASREKFGVFTA